MISLQILEEPKKIGFCIMIYFLDNLNPAKRKVGAL